ncbi:MAG: triose-phosphate isomerase [Synergistaceae bacterium]|nr:triose-phosphate isomerase [Synergistaceae bacterium]
MKKIWLYGNWKMNMIPSEAGEYCKMLIDILDRNLHNLYSRENLEICLFPPFLSLPAVLENISEMNMVTAGVQDGYLEDSGAFTGEVSLKMAASAGAVSALVGHSERRHTFGESNSIVAKKLHKSLQVGLTGILCFGETLDQREAGETMTVVDEQLRSAFDGLEEKDGKKLILAYEPVWAIGTGKNARPSDAQEVCAHARMLAVKKFGSADYIPVLYGGSVKASNANELLSQKDIDGALVGGASLKVDTFLAIYEAFRGGQKA